MANHWLRVQFASQQSPPVEPPDRWFGSRVPEANRKQFGGLYQRVHRGSPISVQIFFGTHRYKKGKATEFVNFL
ncbi:MAG: hypothetical protein ACYDBJ_14650 [Aggregatilineales bacterium]